MKQMMRKHNRQFIFAGLMASLLLFTGASAAKAGFIRDAEIEAYIEELGKPLFRAAGLQPGQVRLFIVNDPAINAFVAGGSNMFLHTGLIEQTHSPEMLLGVMAHETGHIVGGHLIRASDTMGQSSIASVVSYILGAAAMAAGGPDVGMAIMSGGSHAATQHMLGHTRNNERAADQAALTYLDQMQVTSEGMLHMFERLRREEKKHVGAGENQYYRSHPLNQERITHIRNHVLESPYQSRSLPDSVQQRHERVRAKLTGFLQEEQQVLRLYPQTDQSTGARIARAVAYMRMSSFEEALDEMDALLASYPNDIYLHELRGHILFDAGRMREAVNAYQRAHQLGGVHPVLRSDYAKALLATGAPEAIREAKAQLTISTRLDPTYHQSWRLLARIYGKEGNIGHAELALAELAALNQNKSALLKRLEAAEKHIDAYSPEAIRMEDLRLLAATFPEKSSRDRKVRRN